MGTMKRLAGGVGPGEASRELRRGSGKHLRARRRATALTLVSIGSMSLIALYQMAAGRPAGGAGRLEGVAHRGPGAGA